MSEPAVTDRDDAAATDGEPSDADGATAGPARDGGDGAQGHTTVPGAPAEPAAKSFDWRGWTLVGALVVALLVVPWTIISLRQAQTFLASLGLGLRDAYLVLPLLPALGLGALAVWSAVASRRDRADQR